MARLAGAVFGEHGVAPELSNMLVRHDHLHEEEGVHIGGEGPQLLWHQSNTVWLMGDGYLSNRESLLSQMGSLGYPASVSDGELILQAYRHWGPAFPAHLEGSFALVLYDKSLKELLMVRDGWGSRPLFWCSGAQHLYFASALKSLLASGNVAQMPAPEAIAAYLSLGFIPQDLTPIRNVYRLLPGHLLRFRSTSGVTVQAYPQPQRAHSVLPSEMPPTPAINTTELVHQLIPFIWDMDEPIGIPGAYLLWLAGKTQGQLIDPFRSEKSPLVLHVQRRKIPGWFHWIRPVSPRWVWPLLRHPYLAPETESLLSERLLCSESQRRHLSPDIDTQFNPQLLLQQTAQDGADTVDFDSHLVSPYLAFPILDRTAAARQQPWFSDQVLRSRAPNLSNLYAWPAGLDWRHLWAHPDWKRLFRLMRRHSFLVESRFISHTALRQICTSPNFTRTRLAWALLQLEGWMRLFVERTPTLTAPDLSFEMLLAR